MIVWPLLDLQSLPIPTKIVSLNPSHSEVYSIQHYVIKFVSDNIAVGLWFSPGTVTTPISSTKLAATIFAEMVVERGVLHLNPNP